ncbi:hypothetical protein COB64_00080 [Candidatus Wolfebacteria bacterium]|nr:MAG: hypothetical protein COB64_00080 [Candidatus Wolfebacteria bacterium]
MKKIVIVEDNRSFKDILKMVIENNFNECKIIDLIEDQDAIKAISSTDSDFDVLLLDGNLGWGGHGRNVLNILNEDQLKKTIICSADDKFIKEAQKKDITVFLDKGFFGIRASKIHLYILEILQKIQS